MALEDDPRSSFLGLASQRRAAAAEYRRMAALMSAKPDRERLHGFAAEEERAAATLESKAAQS